MENLKQFAFSSFIFVLLSGTFVLFLALFYLLAYRGQV